MWEVQETERDGGGGQTYAQTIPPPPLDESLPVKEHLEVAQLWEAVDNRYLEKGLSSGSMRKSQTAELY